MEQVNEVLDCNEGGLVGMEIELRADSCKVFCELSRR